MLNGIDASHSASVNFTANIFHENCIHFDRFSGVSDSIARESLVVHTTVKSRYGIYRQHLIQENQLIRFVSKL